MPTKSRSDSNLSFQECCPVKTSRLQHLSERGEGGGVDGGVGGVGGACVWSVSHGDSVVAPPLTLLGAGKEFESAVESFKRDRRRARPLTSPTF